MFNFLNRGFKLDENKTTVRTEIVAGLTTFFAMCYIVVVNPGSMMGEAAAKAPHLFNACFVGGIIAAVVATICMAFIANKPFALAAGMGLNSFFFVSFILPQLLNARNIENGYQAGLSVILISGVLFLILSLTGARQHIAKALPDAIKVAVPAGIGMFIAFIGLQNAGIVQANPYTGVAFATFRDEANHFIPATAISVLTAFFGFVLVIIFSNSKHSFLKKGAMIIAILIATVFYYLTSFIFIENYFQEFK